MANLNLTTLSGNEAVLDGAAVEEFASRLRGKLIRPEDDDFDAVRRVWNGMIDRRPGLIVRCMGAADVVDCVDFARTHDLLVAVRGGGHNVAGNAVCDGGLMIDLSLMTTVHVDPKARTARVQGGATLGDVDRETQLFGLATALGVVSATGVAGLTLGGGIGHLRRKHGLSCDNLLSVDIVTADGEIRTASKTENEDLFWAIRGGGGNFGIVTSFEFRLHPVGPMVMLCVAMYPFAQARDVFRAWREFTDTAPDEFSSIAQIWNVPDVPAFPDEARGKPVAIIAGVYAGPVDEGESFVQPLRELATPILDLSGPAPFTAVQASFDPFFPKGEHQNYWKSTYVSDLSDEAIDLIVNHGGNRPSPRTMINTWHMGGAVGRMGPEATAFGDRSAPYLLEISSSWSDPQDTDRNVTWTREFWSAMQPHSSGGLYLNFQVLAERGEDPVRAAYGANYDRLVATKIRYDPTNMFRLNQNIRPDA